MPADEPRRAPQRSTGKGRFRAAALAVIAAKRLESPRSPGKGRFRAAAQAVIAAKRLESPRKSD